VVSGPSFFCLSFTHFASDRHGGRNRPLDVPSSTLGQFIVLSAMFLTAFSDS